MGCIVVKRDNGRNHQAEAICPSHARLSVSLFTTTTVRYVVSRFNIRNAIPRQIGVTMAITAKTKSKSRRGRPKLESQQVLYQVKVSGWDMSWSFNLARPDFSRANEGHYSEHMILTLKGEVVYPEHFKYPEAECQLYADARLFQDAEAPRGIGSMTASGKRLAIYVSVPRERMCSLIGAAERLVSLELYATPLHYRRGLVKSIHLGTEPEPDW